MRRFDKLKKLYKEIEFKKNTAKNTSKYTFGLVILFIAFIIAIVTDFILPLSFDYDSDYYGKDNADLFDKEKRGALNVVTGILGMIVASVICCPYTIIGNLYFNNTSIFKNDLAENNKCGEYCEYDDNEKFKTFLQKNYHIYNILKN